MTEQEFAQLVRENKSTIYTVCYMFSNDQDEVNDLFQEVLINLWRGIDSFKGDAKVTSWIYRVSLNTCISADRKKKHQATVPLSMDISLRAHHVAYKPIADNRLFVKFLMKKVELGLHFFKVGIFVWIHVMM